MLRMYALVMYELELFIGEASNFFLYRIRKSWVFSLEVCKVSADSLLSEQQNCKSLLTKCRGSVSLDLCIVAEFSIYSNIHRA